MTRALVIGGGTGGLITALWLHRVGVEVTIFEAVPKVKSLGVGINLLPMTVPDLVAARLLAL